MPSTLAFAQKATGLCLPVDLRAGSTSYVGGQLSRSQAGLLSALIRTPACLGLHLCSRGGSHCGGGRGNFAEPAEPFCPVTGHVNRSPGRIVCLVNKTWRAARKQCASGAVLSSPYRQESHSRRGQLVKFQAAIGPSGTQSAGEPESLEKVPVGGGEDGQKVCLVCGVAKSLRTFGDLASSADKRQVLCRACNAKFLVERRGKDLHHLAMPVAEAWAQARMCPRCKQVQELREYARDLGVKDGLARICRSCFSERNKRFPHQPRAETGRCSRCNEEKPGKAFSRRKQSKTGLASYCKVCSLEVLREHRATAQMSEKVRREDKVCPSCNKTKLPKEFSALSSARDGLQSQCKECVAGYYMSRKEKRCTNRLLALGSPHTELHDGRAVLHSTMESET